MTLTSHPLDGPTSSPRTRPLRVVIVDDHAPMRSLVRATLDRTDVARVVAEASGASQEVLAACERDPDVVLLDQHLGAVRGTDLLGDILRACPTAMIAIFSALPPEDVEEGALQAGAFAFYEKDLVTGVLPEVLVADHELFRQALQGEDVCAPSATDRRRTLGTAAP
jgi:two-component system, NarL family, response regulator DevR